MRKIKENNDTGHCGLTNLLALRVATVDIAQIEEPIKIDCPLEMFLIRGLIYDSFNTRSRDTGQCKQSKVKRE